MFLVVFCHTFRLKIIDQVNLHLLRTPVAEQLSLSLFLFFCPSFYSTGPTSVASVTAGEPLTVKGYAYSGGGRGIVRVDVSIDNGVTWRTATLLDGNSLPNLPGTMCVSALQFASFFCL